MFHFYFTEIIVINLARILQAL